MQTCVRSALQVYGDLQGIVLGVFYGGYRECFLVISSFQCIPPGEKDRFRTNSHPCWFDQSLNLDSSSPEAGEFPVSAAAGFDDGMGFRFDAQYEVVLHD